MSDFTPVLRYVASFKAACGRTRYVGEGATMPFHKDDARLFETKAAAKAAAAKIGAHHMKPGAVARTAERWVFIVKPVIAAMLDEGRTMTGQQAYEAELAARPNYEDGAARKPWDDLPDYAKASWDKNPTSRF